MRGGSPFYVAKWFKKLFIVNGVVGRAIYGLHPNLTHNLEDTFNERVSEFFCIWAFINIFGNYERSFPQKFFSLSSSSYRILTLFSIERRVFKKLWCTFQYLNTSINNLKLNFRVAFENPCVILTVDMQIAIGHIGFFVYQ